MQQLGFRSVFAKLFASVMLALILFAIAMVLLTQLVHDKDAGIRSEVVATQILGQIDPFLQELNVAVSKDNRLQARFMLAVVKKSFDIFDESLQAKMGLYDNTGHLLMQTDNSDLPLELPDTPSLLTRVFPSFSDTPATQQAQVYSSTGYTLLYESRLTPKKPALSAALNLFTGTLLLLLIMAGVLWLIARTMTWRINQMSQQMAQLGDGDFTVRVNSRGNDEIASLARGFNQAAQKIEHLVNANSLLLAHASHELRTPITRIRLQIEMMDMLARSMPNDIKEKFDKRAQAINRDLSGLNDLVESILLVSRLDAGHAMQQIERVDFYDLINQERQHYSEATLIGEHIVIDGQPAMLTHLIRNLLNNAMLHGVPPVTVLLYGVQDRADADTIPDYLLQSIVDSSFADYNCLTDADEDTLLDTSLALLNDDSDTADNVTKSKSDPLALGEHLDAQDALSAPVIYRNGETLTPPSDDEKGPDQLASPKTVDSASGATFDTSTRNDEGDADTTAAVKEPRFSAASHGVPTEVMALDKAIFSPAPDDTSISLLTNTTTVQSVQNNAKADGADKPDGLNDNDANNEPRKESLFLKHLKKTKPEPARPLPKYAVLAVIDEGAGIPEDKREEIFSPFVRLQQKNKGSGLGLSLVSQIVSAHQGHIINDTINGHTRFLVILPVKHDPHYHSPDEHD
ncbi:sensor histidine kinase [Psychrobacter sp. F1192]|uniref:histidine kinase n=1 Tax=Psychrobacter coccoides TaxID=2818440 RepID=A0ABS3NR71_9GAMM|nr:sensor histidine kinase [Psychrobacter coccoides]MBO1531539.1 sensor histidine kinase [Psychrobacter coccoides]